MSEGVCITVDVEDWYDSMRRLGCPVPRPKERSDGLEDLHDLLRASPDARLTLFVVADVAQRNAQELISLAREGHEIGSHGVEHGRMPEDPGALHFWLVRARQTLEDVLQQPIHGFRSPLFAKPASLSLAAYREALARAGFTYVSDRDLLGPGSPVRELPVHEVRGLPLGGGSYQRVLPRPAVRAAIQRASRPAVLYYHSYDFGNGLPVAPRDRRLPVLKQVLARQRIAPVFANLLTSYGSETCRDVAAAV
jgi:peptidoglycan/xylan/chitin deacetylase (PgdA/CDA1 family)